MNIFADQHHSGAARAQILLFQVRLNHKIYFGGTEFVDHINKEYGMRKIQRFSGQGDWLPVVPSWLIGMGGVPKDILSEDGSWEQIVTFEEFMDTEWDIFLTTRIETQYVFKHLKEIHPHGDKIKIIALTGNDNTAFDWGFIKNFMASDYPSYFRAPWDINKIHYSQEMGSQFGATFVPIDEKSLRTVTCFINCWPSFTGEWSPTFDLGTWGSLCPHCLQGLPRTPELPVRPYEIWTGAQELLPNYTFNDYGINCKIGCKPEIQLPIEYASGALSVHMKTYDGYGFSMLQSIACGRPVIVPRRFHRYRTANHYLIPNVTCFEAEWNAHSVVEIVKYVTESVDRANHYARACWDASKGLFNWEHEAWRVGEFLGRLI